MSEMTSGRRFSWRAMTSMMTTGGFLIMGATGLMLFATPEGRLAYWVDWSLGGLTKEEWGAIHVTSSLLFLVAGFIHLWFNWRQFVAYLRHRLERKLSIRPEAPAAAALLAVLVAGTLWGVDDCVNRKDAGIALWQEFCGCPFFAGNVDGRQDAGLPGAQLPEGRSGCHQGAVLLQRWGAPP